MTWPAGVAAAVADCAQSRPTQQVAGGPSTRRVVDARFVEWVGMLGLPAPVRRSCPSTPIPLADDNPAQLRTLIGGEGQRVLLAARIKHGAVRQTRGVGDGALGACSKEKGLAVMAGSPLGRLPFLRVTSISTQMYC